MIRKKEHYILLEEVIPGARVISREEGILEYKGSQYIVGVHDLKNRQQLIEHFDLLQLESQSVVDMRFDTQVIIIEGSGTGIPGPRVAQ